MSINESIEQRFSNWGPRTPRGSQRDHLVETVVLMFMPVLATISVILNYNSSNVFLDYIKYFLNASRCFLFYLGRLLYARNGNCGWRCNKLNTVFTPHYISEHLKYVLLR